MARAVDTGHDILPEIVDAVLYSWCRLKCDDDTFPQISLDELSSLESGDSSIDEMAELSDLLHNAQSYNACLFGLGSVLEDPAEKAIPGFHSSQSSCSIIFLGLT